MLTNCVLFWTLELFVNDGLTGYFRGGIAEKVIHVMDDLWSVHKGLLYGDTSMGVTASVGRIQSQDQLMFQPFDPSKYSLTDDEGALTEGEDDEAAHESSQTSSTESSAGIASQTAFQEHQITHSNHPRARMSDEGSPDTSAESAHEEQPSASVSLSHYLARFRGYVHQALNKYNAITLSGEYNAESELDSDQQPEYNIDSFDEYLKLDELYRDYIAKGIQQSQLLYLRDARNLSTFSRTVETCILTASLLSLVLVYVIIFRRMKPHDITSFW